MRVFAGRVQNGRPVQTSRTVNGTEQDEVRVAAETSLLLTTRNATLDLVRRQAKLMRETVRHRCRAFLVAFVTGVAVLIPCTSSGASSTSSTWASLGTLGPTAEQSSQWGSAVDAIPSSSTYAWCGADGIRVAQSNGVVRTVSENGIEAKLAARALNVNHNSKVVCDVVAADPLHPDTMYAGFEAGQNYSVPPVAVVAMFTRNDGKSWHFIPPPTNMTYLDFGGFALRNNVVQAIFTDEVEFARPSSRWSIKAETDVNNSSWVSGSLTCPTVGACVTFGPQIPQGACGMSEWQQPLLVAVPGGLSADPVWQGTSWTSGIPQCDPALLFAAQNNTEYLLDFATRDPLVRSVDGGHHWRPVQLPERNGHKIGGSPTSGNDVSMITPAGDLLVVIGPAYAATEQLLLLVPGAAHWCSVSGVLPPGTRAAPIRALGATASRLVLLQASTIGAIAQGGAERSVPLTAIRCVG